MKPKNTSKLLQVNLHFQYKTLYSNFPELYVLLLDSISNYEKNI